MTLGAISAGVADLAIPFHKLYTICILHKIYYMHSDNTYIKFKKTLARLATPADDTLKARRSIYRTNSFFARFFFNNLEKLYNFGP